MTDYFDDHLRSLIALQEQMRKFAEPPSGLLAIQEQMRKFAEPPSGLLALQEQIRKFAEPPSGLLALQEQIRKFAEPSPGMLALQEQVRKFSEQSAYLPPIREQLSKFAEPSPAIIAFQEQIRSFAASPGVRAFQEQMRALAERPTGVLSTYNEQMRKVMEVPSHFLAMQDQLRIGAEHTASFRNALSVAGWAGRFPTATVFEPLFAERLVALARAEGELAAVIGTSLTIDIAAAADEIADVSPVPAAFLDFLDRLGPIIRHYLEAARSIADLAHLNNITSQVLMAAALWYAIHASTSEDIDKLRTTVEQQPQAVDHQTSVLREEFQASRKQFAEKLEELTRAVQQLATNKAATFAPVTVYTAERATPVKAERKMKSQTIGWLQVGQAAFVIARDKKWVQIEYVDLSTGQSENGWVVKKYLKRL